MSNLPFAVGRLSDWPTGDNSPGQAAERLRELARCLPTMQETILAALRNSVDGPYPTRRAVEALQELWKDADYSLRLCGEVPPELPTAVETVGHFRNEMVRLERYLIAVAGRVEGKTHSQDATQTPIDGEALLAKVVATLGGDTAAQILAVAQDKTKTVDQRQRDIYDLDNTALAWDGQRWATLCDVSASAARSTDWWKVDRKRLRSD